MPLWAVPGTSSSSTAQPLATPPARTKEVSTATACTPASSSSAAVPALPPPSQGYPTSPGNGSRSSTGTNGSTSIAEEVRLRFYNYNMGNNNFCTNMADLQGPGGRGPFAATFNDLFPDGSEADVVFVTFVETRLIAGEWVQEILKSQKGRQLDTVLRQNARREGALHTRIRVRGWIETMAGAYNGNLKSLLAFGGSRFREDPRGLLFGRLTEARVAGVPVPNPKKAFMGRSIVRADVHDLRFCFVSAHFPIMRLAAALEEVGVDQLQLAKVAVAQNLRKVLKKAARRGIADGQTALFLQGDLNSRTVLRTESPENEYCVRWDRSGGEPLGLEFDASGDGHSVLITGISSGLVEVWNREHSEAPVNTGDRITEINGYRGRADRLLEALQEKKALLVKIVRTVADALLEVIRDDAMQAAIQAGLGLPPGRWLEIASYDTAQDLPVTYKFLDHAPLCPGAPVGGSTVEGPPSGSGCGHGSRWGHLFDRSSTAPIPSMARAVSTISNDIPTERPGGPLPPPMTGPTSLTIGDIISAERSCMGPMRSAPHALAPQERSSLASPATAADRRQTVGHAKELSSRPSGGPPLPAMGASGVELYRRLLGNLGQEQLQQLGLFYKKSDFKAFRFPACADRLVLWAPDTVADRLSFELPRGGYQVNLCQFGSDHRPVALEVVMRVAKPGHAMRSSRTLAPLESEDLASLLEQHSEDEDDNADDDGGAAREPWQQQPAGSMQLQTETFDDGSEDPPALRGGRAAPVSQRGASRGIMGANV